MISIVPVSTDAPAFQIPATMAAGLVCLLSQTARATTTVEASAPNPGATISTHDHSHSSPTSQLFHGTYVSDTSVSLNRGALMSWTWVHKGYPLPWHALQKRSEFPEAFTTKTPSDPTTASDTTQSWANEDGPEISRNSDFSWWTSMEQHYQDLTGARTTTSSYCP